MKRLKDIQAERNSVDSKTSRLKAPPTPPRSRKLSLAAMVDPTQTDPFLQFFSEQFLVSLVISTQVEPPVLPVVQKVIPKQSSSLLILPEKPPEVKTQWLQSFVERDQPEVIHDLLAQEPHRQEFLNQTYYAVLREANEKSYFTIYELLSVLINEFLPTPEKENACSYNKKINSLLKWIVLNDLFKVLKVFLTFKKLRRLALKEMWRFAIDDEHKACAQQIAAHMTDFRSLTFTPNRTLLFSQPKESTNLQKINQKTIHYADAHLLNSNKHFHLT